MKLRPFEIGLIAFFFFAAIGGILFFANYKGESEIDTAFDNEVLIWGTVNSVAMQDFLSAQVEQNPKLRAVRYERKDPRTFERDFVDAVADGNSPDVLIIPHTMLVSLRTKLQPINYESFPVRTFRDTYIDGANIFAMSDGIYGFPFAVDPLVLFWNKDIFSSNGIAQPPKTWETIVGSTVETLTVRDGSQGISQSAIGMGEYGNITNAKNILSLLLLQTGNEIVKEVDNGYQVTLNDTGGGGIPAGEAALNFYTSFADRQKALYTWNRSKGNDRSEFLSGSLGLYFGKGSEYSILERENPNANFDIAPVPQSDAATVRRTYGDFYAFSIPRAARNKEGALATVQLFSSPTAAQDLVDRLEYAPALRSLFTGAANDPYKSVVYPAALMSFGWLDPAPRESAEVFKKMIERTLSEGVRGDSVLRDSVYELEKLF